MGNEDLLFKSFSNKWNDIVEEGIDMDNLSKFDWKAHRGTELEREAENALLFLRKCLIVDGFPRGDYRELCQQAVIWLGGHVDGFIFHVPGAMHHARLIYKGKYNSHVFY